MNIWTSIWLCWHHSNFIQVCFCFVNWWIDRMNIWTSIWLCWHHFNFIQVCFCFDTKESLYLYLYLPWLCWHHFNFIQVCFCFDTKESLFLREIPQDVLTMPWWEWQWWCPWNEIDDTLQLCSSERSQRMCWRCYGDYDDDYDDNEDNDIREICETICNCALQGNCSDNSVMTMMMTFGNSNIQGNPIGCADNAGQ